MRTLSITATVSDDATPADIERMAYAALVQVEDPADEDGEHATFTVSDANVSWATTA